MSLLKKSIAAALWTTRVVVGSELTAHYVHYAPSTPNASQQIETRQYRYSAAPTGGAALHQINRKEISLSLLSVLLRSDDVTCFDFTKNRDAHFDGFVIGLGKWLAVRSDNAIDFFVQILQRGEHFRAVS